MIYYWKNGKAVDKFLVATKNDQLKIIIFDLALNKMNQFTRI